MREELSPERRARKDGRDEVLCALSMQADFLGQLNWLESELHWQCALTQRGDTGCLATIISASFPLSFLCGAGILTSCINQLFVITAKRWPS